MGSAKISAGKLTGRLGHYPCTPVVRQPARVQPVFSAGIPVPPGFTADRGGARLGPPVGAAQTRTALPQSVGGKSAGRTGSSTVLGADCFGVAFVLQSSCRETLSHRPAQSFG